MTELVEQCPLTRILEDHIAQQCPVYNTILIKNPSAKVADNHILELRVCVHQLHHRHYTNTYLFGNFVRIYDIKAIVFEEIGYSTLASTDTSRQPDELKL
jgi:hypothetical protein